mgnify:FL=1
MDAELTLVLVLDAMAGPVVHDHEKMLEPPSGSPVTEM